MCANRQFKAVNSLMVLTENANRLFSVLTDSIGMLTDSLRVLCFGSAG